MVTFEGANQKVIGETEGAFPSAPCTIKETNMKLALIGAAAVAAATFATPALAQQVIEDPGYCAQFYPNAKCGYYRNDRQSGNAPIESRGYSHHPTHGAAAPEFPLIIF
jgi:hypothetical protein